MKGSFDDRRRHRVRPRAARRLRGDQQGSRDTAYAADVGRQRHSRHRPRRRLARRRPGPRPGRLRVRVRRRCVRVDERGRWLRGHRPDAADVPGQVMNTITTVIQYVLLAAAACFVLGLHLMNHPARARRGNQLSAAGMVAAVGAALILIADTGAISTTGWLVVAAAVTVGSTAGLYAARTVKMTAMPQLVSVFNAVGGGAAALLAVSDLTGAGPPGVPARIGVPAVLDIVIGAVT